MITWMQRHKKWLIITIWISTIAFIGAGFMGWGQYKYGSKANAVAKVGDVKISMSQLQKSYSNLYQQYNKMFQGNFDEEKAKQFGLKKQALQQLLQQALLLNLAESYDLMVTDEELFNVIKSQKVFYKDGAFDKNTYKLILSQNRMSPKEYEQSLRRELLIEKTLKLLPVKTSANEKEIVSTLLNIADKINYKVLSPEQITLNPTDDELKKFWSGIKDNFKTEVAYEIKYIKLTPQTKQYDNATIQKYYTENKMHFRSKDGKILPLNDAKEAVIAELDKKATKKQALKTYIAFKKGKLASDLKPQELTLTESKNPLGAAALKRIKTLSLSKPFAKPLLVNNSYYIIMLVKTIPAKTETFAVAKERVLPLYLKEKRQEKLLALANNSVKNFVGETTDFITVEDAAKLKNIAPNDALEFLQKLFISDKKNSYITLKDGKIVLYNILEQKLLTNNHSNKSDVIGRLKNSLFEEGLLKTLQNKYQTEIYIKGL